MNKIYTKKGDTGNTHTACGLTLAKNTSLLEAQGNVDELNCHIGLIATTLSSQSRLKPFYQPLIDLQNTLFTLGAELSMTNTNEKITMLSTNEVEQLEKMIDAWQKDLPPLKQFILPGGSILVAEVHIARAVCRRAERSLVGIDNINPVMLSFINRLSDWLFVLARTLCYQTQQAEIIWQANNKKQKTS